MADRQTTAVGLRDVIRASLYVGGAYAAGTPIATLEGVIRDTPWTSLPYHVRASLTLEADAMLAADDER